ncbi:UNKNOWN [Stylonychia lemnae]|uniref:Uncharacterized protein n=1 Tax=Stylonychia lemnae TaxID=5949 RepID=A0A078AHU6_STYLE|nr:UNKNOWN [Stylonychia lemnae]|eukprot:CDW81466.1 UNKNOWN [Stylonychia lemnae]
MVAYLSDDGIKALSNIGLAPYVILVGYRLNQFIRNKRKFGTLVNYGRSNYFDEFQNFKWKNLIPLLGNGLTNLFNLVTITMAFKYAKLANMNQGIVSTLNTLTSVYNLFIFYFGFGERVTIIQFIGMLVMLSCIAFVSISTRQEIPENSPQSYEDLQYNAGISLIYAFLSPLCLSIKHIFVRKYRQQYNSWDVSIDALIFEYQIYILFAVYYFLNESLVWSDLIIGTVGSLFMASGKVLIVLAVANGLAGPAASLASTQILYVTILSIIVSGQGIKTLEVMALVFGFLGATIISSGDFMYKKLFKQNQ